MGASTPTTQFFSRRYVDVKQKVKISHLRSERDYYTFFYKHIPTGEYETASIIMPIPQPMVRTSLLVQVRPHYHIGELCAKEAHGFS